MSNTSEQGVHSDLLQHKTAIVGVLIHQVGIPLTKIVVWSLVHRMIEIVCPRIESQLVQVIRIELSVLQNLWRCRPQYIQSTADDFKVRTERDAYIANIQRDGTKPFVRVWLQTPSFKHGNRSKAHIVIETIDRFRNDSVDFVPWPPLLKNALDRSTQEQTIEQAFGFLMEQQVAVKV